MSAYLWRYYLEDDLENFQRLLAATTYSASALSKGHGGGTAGSAVGSPGRLLPTWHIPQSKSKSQPGWLSTSKGTKGSASVTLTRADINARDARGVTLLHQIASSTAENASSYALSFLALPLLDLYVQDLESGWTSLHRALYFGNATIARALMDRDIRDATELGGSTASHTSGGLIKIKDREGNSPFDVFGATITNRILRHGTGQDLSIAGNGDEEVDMAQADGGNDDDSPSSRIIAPRACIDGDELFTFGSNKNLTLGFGDEDDRQFPERVALKRPEHLLCRLFAEHQRVSRLSNRGNRSLQQEESNMNESNAMPALVQFRAITILDVQLSKLHSAVLTTDPEANLYICGFGPGGRLGTGDQSTRFTFTCIYGGGLLNKKIINVALGQNHTITVSSHGEVFSWGNNAYGQLGYSLPTSNTKDDDPVQLLPRQIFGPLKRETVLGCAASRVHSVVHTSTSLYTFGKNDGQLGLVDSDARSLEIQVTPRKVAASLFSSLISMVAAIDKATICLLENHDVWVFANYGWKRVAFPLDGFSNYFLKNSYTSTRYETASNHVTKICSGGDTICAMAKSGDVFTISVTQNIDSMLSTGSTTNPSKIRGALSPPQRIWSLRKSHMAVRDVDVGQDGSVIICTESGSVWQRVKRAKIKDTCATPKSSDYKPKDYKFSRIPGLTRITAVRSNAFGAFAAVRRDTDVLRSQVATASNTLWKDLFPLLPFHRLSKEEDSETEQPQLRFWTPQQPASDPATIRHAALTSKSLEDDVSALIVDGHTSGPSKYDMTIGTTVSDVRIPCHEFMLAGRSSFLRRSLQTFRQSYYFDLPEVMTIEYDKQGNTLILFQGVDFLTVFNLVFYVYTDFVVDVWHHTRHAPQRAIRYRQVRSELMKLAAHLSMRGLENSTRLMVAPTKDLHTDMEAAFLDSAYFETGDVEIELANTSMRGHAALLCQRCPFFEGLFQGRAGGSWLSSRRESLREPQEFIKVDMKHINHNVFSLVLRHIYADTGDEMFDDVITADLDSFLDLIMDVMSVANELMVDRLAQICQKVLGRFVNTRNVCQLLIAVAPCSVTEFKDAALEYICLNLEGMLENHLLNELDDDLMLELDEVVRENQLARLPFAKSGRAEAELFERHPQLASLVERGKQTRIDSMTLQSRLHEDDIKFTAANRGKAGSNGDARKSPIIQPLRSDSSQLITSRSSPLLKPRRSAVDLMFEMDEEAGAGNKTALHDGSITHDTMGVERGELDHRQTQTPSSSVPKDEMWFDAKGKALSPPSPHLPSSSFTGLGSPRQPLRARVELREARSDNPENLPSPNDKVPWKAPAFTSPKIDMKDILAQAPSIGHSQLSSAFSLPNRNVDSVKGVGPAKLSQKERKKQLQQQQMHSSATPASPELQLTSPVSSLNNATSPWRAASLGTKVSLKDVLQTAREKSPRSPIHNERIPSSPVLTLNQTVPGNTPTARRISAEHVSQVQSKQQRTVSTPGIAISTTSALSSPVPRPFLQPRQAQPDTASSSGPSMTIKSVRHNPLPVEPSLQLSMADILAQQQTEKDIIKEAAAKRSLQEIQEEQAFQEWWDQEEAATKARLMEEAAAATKPPVGSGGNRSGRPGRGGRGKGRPGASRGRARGGKAGHEGGTAAAGATSADGEG